MRDFDKLIVAVLCSYQKKVMVSDELPDGQMVDQWEPIGEDSVQTPLEASLALRNTLTASFSDSTDSNKAVIPLLTTKWVSTPAEACRWLFSRSMRCCTQKAILWTMNEYRSLMRSLPKNATSTFWYGLSPRRI